MQTNGKPQCRPRYFFRQVIIIALVFFSGRCIGHIHLTRKKRGEAGLPVVGWCMINTAPKNHIQIKKKIERRINYMAKQRTGVLAHLLL